MDSEKTSVEIELENLPFIPERVRFFAFDYAPIGKEKPRAEWAKQYGVKTSTIEKWLRSPGVRQYIEMVRTEAKKGHLEELRCRLREIRKAGLRVST